MSWLYDWITVWHVVMAAVGGPLWLVVHELSHAAALKLLGWHVDYIRLWPHRRARYDRGRKKWVFDGKWSIGAVYGRANADSIHTKWGYIAPYITQTALMGLFAWGGMSWTPMWLLFAWQLAATIYHIGGIIWKYTVDGRNIRK